MVVKSVNSDHLNESATVANLDIWLSECLASVKVLIEENKKKDGIITALTTRITQLEKNSNNSCTTTTRPKKLDYASWFNNDKKTTEDLILLAKVTKELNDKNSRLGNIVISGLPESASNDQKEIDRFDKKQVEGVLQLLIPGEQYGRDFSSKITRLRKSSKTGSSNKPAPLLVSMAHGHDYQQIALECAKKLKTTSGFEKVFVSPDLTAADLKTQHELRKERNERNKKLQNAAPEGGQLQSGTSDGKNYLWVIRSGELRKIELK